MRSQARMNHAAHIAIDAVALRSDVPSGENNYERIG